MKILCLHGMGTNADIFKAQSASFRSLLPSHFAYDFLEGENDCPAADGIAEIYPEPYICWYPFPPTTNRVADAHEMIWDIIREDGPFDGVMGFSQGAALIASILLHHEIHSALEPSPFRFAVFICGSLPFSVDDSCGFDLTNVLARFNDPMPGDVEEWKRLVNQVAQPGVSYFDLSRQDNRRHLEDHDQVSSPGSVCSLTAMDNTSDSDSGYESAETPGTPRSLLESDVSIKDNTALSLSEKIEALTGSTISACPVRRFHPAVDTVRISIPTAHIYGKNDPYFSQSLELVRMCQADLVQILDHGGAHDIPRSEVVSRSIADAIEKTITKSEFML